jgi:oligoendopeptidase F
LLPFFTCISSTVNELLLSRYLLEHSTDENEKLVILNNLMELFKATIIRQTMFAEFERDVHAAKEKGKVLTHEYLEDEYYKLNELYFGDSVTLDDNIKYEWSRIPHFYYNFYVYKYVVGLSCASYIVDSILSGKKNARENYIKFLSSGGSMYPTEELKIAGIDITKKEVIESALKMFDKTIDEFQKTYQKVKKK